MTAEHPRRDGAGASLQDRLDLIAQRCADLKLALDYAISVMGRWEPGDSRAVSDEFVSMLSISCDLTNPECRTILAQAIEAATAGETAQTGSTEGESAVPQECAQRPTP